MRGILSVLSILALVALATPVMAQQPTTGQDKSTDSMNAGDQGMTTDTAGMSRTGVSQPSGERMTTPEPTSPQPTKTEQPTKTDEMNAGGGAMPTTASPLPTLLLAGVVLLGLGLGFRYVRGRS